MAICLLSHVAGFLNRGRSATKLECHIVGGQCAAAKSEALAEARLELMSISKRVLGLVLLVLVAAARPAAAQITTAGALGMLGLVSRNTLAFDPIHKVYLSIVNRPPVTGRFLDEHGVQIGSDFVIATEPGFTAWASIALGGPPNDPVFLVTYLVADQVNNPKFGRLVRYGPGGASVGPAVFIANVASEWGHSEKAQNVWSGQNFIVGTRMPTGGPLPTFQVQTFDLNGGVSAPVDLGDGADYYGSPALACSTANVNTCMAVGFMAGYYTGFSGGSYGRLFNETTLAVTTPLFHVATGMANEDQQVVLPGAHGPVPHRVVARRGRRSHRYAAGQPRRLDERPGSGEGLCGPWRRLQHDLLQRGDPHHAARDEKRPRGGTLCHGIGR